MWKTWSWNWTSGTWKVTVNVHRAKRSTGLENEWMPSSITPCAPLLSGLAQQLEFLAWAFSLLGRSDVQLLSDIVVGRWKGRKFFGDRRPLWMLQWVSSKNWFYLAAGKNHWTRKQTSGITIVSNWDPRRRERINSVKSSIIGGHLTNKKEWPASLSRVSLHFSEYKANEAGIKCLCGFHTTMALRNFNLTYLTNTRFEMKHFRSGK